MVGSSARAHPHRSAGKSHLAQSGSKNALSHDECGTTRGAALFTVVISEAHTFISDTVDVGRPVSHQAVGVAAQITESYVVAPDDENVRFLGFPFLRHVSPFKFEVGPEGE
jgi:hypothetical protein